MIARVGAVQERFELVGNVLQAEHFRRKCRSGLGLGYRQSDIAKLDDWDGRRQVSHAHDFLSCFRDFRGIVAARCWRMMSRQTFISRENCFRSSSINRRTENPRTALSVSARTSLASCLGIPDDIKVSSHAASIEKRVCRENWWVSRLSRRVLSSLIAIESSMKKKSPRKNSCASLMISSIGSPLVRANWARRVLWVNVTSLT